MYIIHRYIRVRFIHFGFVTFRAPILYIRTFVNNLLYEAPYTQNYYTFIKDKKTLVHIRRIIFPFMCTHYMYGYYEWAFAVW